MQLSYIYCYLSTFCLHATRVNTQCTIISMSDFDVSFTTSYNLINHFYWLKYSTMQMMHMVWKYLLYLIIDELISPV